MTDLLSWLNAPAPMWLMLLIAGLLITVLGKLDTVKNSLDLLFRSLIDRGADDRFP